MKSKKVIVFLGLVLLLLIVAGCAPKNEMFISEPAGFWAGLWHGLICGVTFIISLFTDTVSMYEVNNTGRWYDFGFLLGAIIVIGNGGVWGSCRNRIHKKSIREKEWEEIGSKVEEKVRTGIRNWVEESDRKDTDWEEIGKKVEEKIKQELKNWAEK
ncbi:MAG: hypothetical protein K8R68_09395 [Bacteroidales bacterium]|nr:hypothetical protein [Bacteroidales bacterium]